MSGDMDFIILLLLAAFFVFAVMGNNTLEIKEGDPCVPGKLYKMECNTCRCTADINLVCTKMACLSPSAVSEFRNLWKRKPIQNYLGKISNVNVNDKTLRKSGIMSNSQQESSGKCLPGKIYKKPCKKCFCTAEKKLICIKGDKCDLNYLRSTVRNEVIAKLERHKAAVDTQHQLPNIGVECEPGKLYKVACNRCWCSEKRELSTCSRKYCFISALDESKRLSGRHCHKNINRSCLHCECVHNITNCKINPNCGSDLVEGSLIETGSDEDKFALDIEKNKCIPNTTYSMHCNRCHCLDGNLVCTSIKCLTNSQVQVLNQKIAEHGI